jgi:biotin carboxylase
MGIDIGKAYIKSVTGIPVKINKSKNKVAGIRFITANKCGTFKSLNLKNLGYDAVNFVEVVEYLNVGDKINLPQNNIDRIGHIICLGNSYEEV